MPTSLATGLTFLQLCQKLVEKVGISGTGPTTTIAQTGEMSRVVNWINEAYVEIQTMRPNWRWKQKEFSFTTTAQKATYTPAECGLTDFATWNLNDAYCSFRSAVTSQGVGSEVFLAYKTYEAWRDYYQYGNIRQTYGRPTVITQTPNESLGLGLIPDSLGYTIYGEYFTAPENMDADADIPVLPGRYHMLIVYKAMQYYGAYENAPDAGGEGVRMYDKMIRSMENDELPEVTFGGSFGC